MMEDGGKRRRFGLSLKASKKASSSNAKGHASGDYFTKLHSCKPGDKQPVDSKQDGGADVVISDTTVTRVKLLELMPVFPDWERMEPLPVCPLMKLSSNKKAVDANRSNGSVDASSKSLEVKDSETCSLDVMGYEDLPVFSMQYFTQKARLSPVTCDTSKEELMETNSTPALEEPEVDVRLFEFTKKYPSSDTGTANERRLTSGNEKGDEVLSYVYTHMNDVETKSAPSKVLLGVSDTTTHGSKTSGKQDRSRSTSWGTSKINEGTDGRQWIDEDLFNGEDGIDDLVGCLGNDLDDDDIRVVEIGFARESIPRNVSLDCHVVSKNKKDSRKSRENIQCDQLYQETSVRQSLIKGSNASDEPGGSSATFKCEQSYRSSVMCEKGSKKDSPFGSRHQNSRVGKKPEFQKSLLYKDSIKKTNSVRCKNGDSIPDIVVLSDDEGNDSDGDGEGIGRENYCNKELFGSSGTPPSKVRKFVDSTNAMSARSAQDSRTFSERHNEASMAGCYQGEKTCPVVRSDSSRSAHFNCESSVSERSKGTVARAGISGSFSERSKNTVTRSTATRTVVPSNTSMVNKSDAIGSFSDCSKCMTSRPRGTMTRTDVTRNHTEFSKITASRTGVPSRSSISKNSKLKDDMGIEDNNASFSSVRKFPNKGRLSSGTVKATVDSCENVCGNEDCFQENAGLDDFMGSLGDDLNDDDLVMCCDDLMSPTIPVRKRGSATGARIPGKDSTCSDSKAVKRQLDIPMEQSKKRRSNCTNTFTSERDLISRRTTSEAKTNVEKSPLSECPICREVFHHRISKQDIDRHIASCLSNEAMVNDNDDSLW